MAIHPRASLCYTRLRSVVHSCVQDWETLVFSGLFKRKSKSADAPQPAEPTDLPRVDASERIYAIGDIHGRFDLAKAIVTKIVEDAESCSDHRNWRMIFLGDYVDRGDESQAVLEFLTKISDLTASEITFLRGNHEDALLAFLDDPISGKAWLKWGGQQTLASFGAPLASHRSADDELLAARDALLPQIEDKMPFLRGLKSSAVSGDVIFTHAGVKPGVALEDQAESDLVWGHPAFPEKTVALRGKRVVHGHFDNATVVNLPGRLCIDTGAYYTGKLTAVRMDDTETFITT